MESVTYILNHYLTQFLASPTHTPAVFFSLSIASNYRLFFSSFLKIISIIVLTASDFCLLITRPCHLNIFFFILSKIDAYVYCYINIHSYFLSSLRHLISATLIFCAILFSTAQHSVPYKHNIVGLIKNLKTCLPTSLEFSYHIKHIVSPLNPMCHILIENYRPFVQRTINISILVRTTSCYFPPNSYNTVSVLIKLILNLLSSKACIHTSSPLLTSYRFFLQELYHEQTSWNTMISHPISLS